MFKLRKTKNAEEKKPDGLISENKDIPSSVIPRGKASDISQTGNKFSETGLEEKICYLPIKKAFGLDISDASLKAVELGKKGKGFILESHNFMPLPKDTIVHGEIRDEKILIQAIRDLLAKAKPKPITCPYVISSLPEASVFLRPFEFPGALSESQVMNAIPYEAESEMPIKIADMYTDMKVHKSRENNSYHVTFTAAPKKMTDAYLRVLSGAGLKPVVLEIDSPALVRSLVQLSEDPVILMDIGAWSTTITVVERQGVHGYVSVAIGGYHFTQSIAGILEISFAEAEKIKEEKGILGAVGEKRGQMEGELNILLAELMKAAVFHEQHTGRPVKELVVTGGTALAKDMIEFLGKNTRFHVVPGDPFALKNLQYSSSYKDADKQDFSKYKESYASTIGLAIRGSQKDMSRTDLNLLPGNIRECHEDWRTQMTVSILASLFALTIFAVTAYSSKWLVKLYYENQKARFEHDLYLANFPKKEFDEASKEITSINQEIKSLKQFDSKRVDATKSVEAIMAVMPQGVKLLSLKILASEKQEDPLMLELSGMAKTRQDIINLDKNLRGLSDVLEVNAPLSNLDKPAEASFKMSVKMKSVKEDFSKLP